MKTVGWVILLWMWARPVYAQGYDPTIDGWINQVHVDSLNSFVRILSGEDSVKLGEYMILIQPRVDTTGKHLAAEYIRQKFESYGLDVYDQIYNGGAGRNVYAIQSGSTYPAKEFIICAHYDAVTNFGADDNASGVAAVLEAARILSGETLNCTIVYAVWDQEEIGLIGSNRYAARALLNNEDIQGVLNLDMLSWDGNNDGLCDIHAKDVGTSMALANLLVNIDSSYGLPLDPVIYNPGTSASDHASFWNNGYGAVLLIEAYLGSDFTPFYHTMQDRVDKFNFPYFFNMTKLAVGAISTLAAGNPLVAIDDATANVPAEYRIRNYPNPFNLSTVIRYELPEGGITTIDIFNTIGEMVGKPVNGYVPAGSHEVAFDAGRLSSGLYFLRLSSPKAITSTKMVLLK